MILIPHIANANNKLDKHISKIENAIRRTEEIVVPKLGIEQQVDIVFDTMTDIVIPEDGVGGYTHAPDYVRMSIDTSIDVVREDVIFDILTHELTHVARWQRGHEHNYVLFDLMINEGLAIRVEQEIMKESGVDNPQFFLKVVSARSDEENEKIMEILKDQLNSKDYDYHMIFRKGNNELPRWAGYSLGFYLVKKYQKLTGKPIFEIINDSYSEFRKVLKQN